MRIRPIGGITTKGRLRRVFKKATAVWSTSCALPIGSFVRGMNRECLADRVANAWHTPCGSSDSDRCARRTTMSDVEQSEAISLSTMRAWKSGLEQLGAAGDLELLRLVADQRQRQESGGVRWCRG
jgi:hypothetical protein